MRTFAPAIFLGAFLLFLVQPLIGKYILPWFGGGPGVWTVCLLFFQVLLVGGYAYAHLSSKLLRPRAQAVLHLLLLAAALVLLPIIPAESWKPRDATHPTVRILCLLLATVGAPYFLLSATGPLLQRWFSRAHPLRSPYGLYALSNAGSLLALGSYPFLFEAHLARQAQALLWGWGLAAFVLLCALAALKLFKPDPVGAAEAERGVSNPQQRADSKQSNPAPNRDLSRTRKSMLRPDEEKEASVFDHVLWIVLPACASVLLMATTNKLCQDVAVIPFLWVLPLALYLLSFTITFAAARLYPRTFFMFALICAETGVCWAMFHETSLSVPIQIAWYCAGLFVCCMVCHGELYRLRPPPARLTTFYLFIATGGAMGGVLVALVAPLVFADYYELNAGLFLAAVLLLLLRVRRTGDGAGKTDNWKRAGQALLVLGALGLYWFWAEFGKAAADSTKPSIGMGDFFLVGALAAGVVIASLKLRSAEHWRSVAMGAFAGGVIALGTTLWLQTSRGGAGVVGTRRNFYGVLTLYEENRDQPDFHNFRLQHGRTTHGLQFVDPQRAGWPTAYYGEKSGAGLAMRALPPGAHRIGLVGLGAGTLATYGQAGDYFRIYELNPEVTRMAEDPFTYLSRCKGRIEIVPGDARLSLEREPPQQFDVLVLDAFNSDAVPVHLLTREAFLLYRNHVRTNGVIAVHLSNQHLDLVPVVVNVAKHFGYVTAAIDYGPPKDEWWLYPSSWMLLANNEAILNSPAIRSAASPLKDTGNRIRLWTDDFASVFQIMK